MYTQFLMPPPQEWLQAPKALQDDTVQCTGQLPSLQVFAASSEVGHGVPPWLGTLRFPSGALHSTALWLPLRSCACKRPANAPASRALNP